MRKKALPPFVRNCPKCNVVLIYTNVKNRNSANNKHKMCLSCSRKISETNPVLKLRRSIAASRRTGKRNGFYGKHHSIQSKDKMIANRNWSNYKTQAFKDKISALNVGNKNPMFGRSFYDVWLLKHGKEIANERLEKFKRLQSNISSGENNPMFGKPAPKGSGGGWSGWYNDWFFRSLRELSYMINVIEQNRYTWSSGEKISIPYVDYLGHKKTYRPDFLINNTIVVEVKPVKLMNTPNNIAKRDAAVKYCQANNLEYRMIDVSIVKSEKLRKLQKSGKLILTKKYTERLNNEYR